MNHSLNNKVKLLNLINKNPQLRVIPLISNSFANSYNLYSTYTTGCIGNSFISKYCYFNFSGTNEFIMYENKIIIEDYLSKHPEQNSNINIDKINWIPAIFFYLTPSK